MDLSFIETGFGPPPLFVRKGRPGPRSQFSRTLFRKSLDFFGIHGKIVEMDRYLTKYIREDLGKKIIFLTGPRQTGKTTFSKMLKDDFDYFNFDDLDDRLSLQKKSWDRSKELVIFDELHKLKNWKSWLKGIYDTEGMPPSLIVTGSAKLDTYRKVGDSLAGRFFQFRLHPLDLKEIKSMVTPENIEDALDHLLMLGGFPEPFLNGTSRFYNRWKKSHLDIILKQDLIDLENVQQIIQIETLIQLLKIRVGSPVSYNSLARDLQCSDKTVKRWLSILENMYVIFKVPPFHRNIARAIQKMPKFYFYDTGQVIGDSGVKLENTVACALQKEIHFREDCFGETRRLHYLKNKEGKEVDFCITTDETPSLMVEVKWKDETLSPNFDVFRRIYPSIKMVQVTKESKREKTFPNGAEIRIAHNWLAELTLP
jgi:predicted AAA+ superfamily ATPase